MQRFFSTFVILAILAGGFAYLYTQKSDVDAKARIQERLASARRSFAEKARAAITSPDEAEYLTSVKAALRSFDEEVKKVVYADRPDLLDVDRAKKELDASLGKKELTEAQHKGKMERFDLVRSTYDTLVSGSWTPDLTQLGKADTRMDIYGVRRIRGPDGNPLLEAKFFLWGIEPNTRISFGQLSLEYWKEDAPDAATKRQRKKEGRDPNAPVLKVLGRAEGDATPVVMDQNPDKTIAEFPSYVAIGTLWFPQVPQEAKVMDLKYAYTARKGGSDSETVLVWEKMPIPPKWRLEEGEQWMADEVEATAEELAGVDPNAPDAGVAPKK